MAQLSDDALWAIVGSVTNDDKQARYDLLIERHDAGSMPPEEQQVLAHLRREVDALTARKASARFSGSGARAGSSCRRAAAAA